LPSNPGSLWTPGKEYEHSPGISSEETVSVYNTAMSSIAGKIPGAKFNPLASQMQTSWDKSSKKEKVQYAEKARDDCMLVCKVIAPGDADKLFDAITEKSEIEFPVSRDLEILMSAYKNSSSKNLKTQILSLYAYRYSTDTLKKIHEPYEKLTTWQIKRARAHARVHSPGAPLVKETRHRVRLDMVKVEHFVQFIDRPYFYQDVAYGNRVLKLDSGEKIEMPNVVRTVTRSTMVSQYLMFCEEENFEPLSHSTLFKILEAREASQRKSLQGLDNTAADGASGFQTLENIVEELEKVGVSSQWCSDAKRKLKESKRYLKTGYRVHCREDVSTCPDHCRRFALNDELDPNFQEKCSHLHNTKCNDCNSLKSILEEIETKVLSSSAILYSKEQQDDILYDIERAKSDIFQWKAHILRSINQDNAKQDALKLLSDGKSVLIVMDWAMKFLQMKFREKQSDWFGKRGISWHISTVISRDADGEDIELRNYAHLVDGSCQQDWFAVCSVVEHLLGIIKATKPTVTRAILRSDEAGCYHNNNLIAGIRDVSERTGIPISRYDFSEPQYGKDVCDRILCPMKTTIRRYCNEGHDVLSARDMYAALSERPVKGTSACVCSIKQEHENLQVNKIDGFSKYHNFMYEEKGVRVWKAFEVGPGKLILYDQLYNAHQGPTSLSIQEEFFTLRFSRYCKSIFSEREPTAEMDAQFECSEPGCRKVFKTFSELELHLDVGDHDNRKSSETTYDKLRRQWAKKFATIDQPVSNPVVGDRPDEQQPASEPPNLDFGWALQKSRGGSTRFGDNVKDYLTTKFDLGERSGLKADPAQVAADMRNARGEDHTRLFRREDWLSKSQVQGFFCRLAAKRRRHANEEISLEDALEEEQEQERNNLLNAINEDLNLQHPVIYDIFCLCDYVKENKLAKFNVSMLKEILKFFDVSFHSRDRKKDLSDKLSTFVKTCECFS